MIAMRVGKAITLYLSTRGELNVWWYLGQHGSGTRQNSSDALLWLISRVWENRKNNQHTDILMRDISAAFPYISRDKVRGKPRDLDLGVVKWIDTCLDNC
jgi:hypothetical protein